MAGTRWPAWLVAAALAHAALGCDVDAPGVIFSGGDDDGDPDDDTTGSSDDDSLPAECEGGPVWDLQGEAIGLPDPIAAMKEAAQAVNDPGGYGGAFSDLDGDGVLDMFLTNATLAQPFSGLPLLYWGSVDGTFTEGLAGTGIDALPEIWTRTVSPADFDGDGDFDLLILEHGRETPDTDDGVAPLHVYRNEGQRRFTDVTEESGLNDGVNRLGFGASWGDYDQDGDLDVFLSNHFYYEDWDALQAGTVDGDGSRLMRNEGDGTFTDVSHDFPPGTLIGLAYQAYWIDLDGDVDLDLLVGNDYGGLSISDRAFRNDGPGDGGWTWTDVSEESGLNTEGNVMGLAFGDPDHDGDQDLVVSWIGGVVYLVQEAPWTFFDVTDVSFAGEHTGGEASPYNIAWGVMFEDFDNDTWEDLLITFADLQGTDDANTGKEQVDQRNAFFWGGPGGLEFAGEDHVFSDFGKARSLSIADINADGTLDVLMGGMVSGAPHLYLSRPQCTAGHWLQVSVRLEGTMNLYGVGSTVRVTSGGLTQTRLVDGGFRSTMGSSPPMVHFGLGGETVVDLVEVISPTGATAQVTAVAADQAIEVVIP